MAVSTDMLRSWRRPRRVMRELLAMGRREDRVLVYLLAGCLLVFVAQWPRLARVSQVEGTEFDRLVAYEFAGWLMVWPLVFYIIAWASYLILRLFRIDVAAYAARLALFWAFLASTPLGLLYGFTVGMNGPGLGANLAGAAWLAGFAVLWGQNLREAAQSGRAG